MLDVYLGEDGWSKRAGEAAINMELMAKIDLFILRILNTSIRLENRKNVAIEL